MQLCARGANAEAERLYRRALDGREEKLGATHEDTVVAIHNLADVVRMQGRHAAAERLYRRAVDGRKAEDEAESEVRSLTLLIRNVLILRMRPFPD